MLRFSKPVSALLSIFILISLAADVTLAHAGPSSLQEAEPDQQSKQDRQERRQQRRARRTERQREAEAGKTAPDAERATRNGAAAKEETVDVVSDNQSKNGDLWVYEGYVNASFGDMRLQADRVTFNEVTGDMVAEGNVIFDQGADQRVTARRAEINTASSRGVFWDSTGFTNRTQTGDYVFFTARRVEKTGPATYELYDADITACEDSIPKWKFSARRAEVKMGDRITMDRPIFRIKTLPVFALPFAWIPATRDERKSGFLLPTTGTSNQKGRTLKFAYYQTLGESADITFRNDIYTSRGLGFGAEFRAQTDERSFMRLGFFGVKDRLFGEAGEDQGGSAFVGEAVQYLPHGWLAVANVSLVSSLRFRQVFSDDISQVIDPRRESTFYVNNNTRDFSFGFLAAQQTTTLFRPSADPLAQPGSGDNFDIKIRQAPQLDMTLYPRRLFDSLPIYFSFETSLGALKREESVDGEIVAVTPAAVQRFDFQSKVTVPLATFAGFAVTPSLILRETYYSSSVDPGVERFDPDLFTLDPRDPRLDLSRSEFSPGLRLFDRGSLDPITSDSLSRTYGELAVDVRPPALEKYFLADDGSTRFKHLIEPYITYRLIKGIGDEFNEIIRFDERDAVANTNEFEYAIVNRFFTRRSMSDLTRRRGRRNGADEPDQMEIVSPDSDKKKRKKKDKKDDKDRETAPVVDPDAGQPAQAGEVKKEGEIKKEPPPTEESGKKTKLAEGEQAELTERARAGREAPPRSEEAAPAAAPEGAATNDAKTAVATAVIATNEDAPLQPYEFLTIKVAQKYFLDRDFGGALVEGRRNQFFPINSLSGFTYGGRERSFSPAHIEVRYRPLSSLYADLRMDVGSEDSMVRNVVVGGGVRTDNMTVSASYVLSRRIDLAPNRFEPGTFPGNQLTTTVQVGDGDAGLYAGTRISYDFTDRFISNELSGGRLRNSRSYFGYAWDCCGVQFNYNTFKAGLRNESAFSFTFTLAGIGSFGTDQFSQLGGGRGARRRGRRARRANQDDEFLR
jgi:hypothetical protein